MTIQLGFPLPPKEPFSIRYLVTHSGISEAVNFLDSAIENAKEAFDFIVLFGEKGSGKTHLIQAYKMEAIEQNFKDENLSVWEFNLNELSDETKISEFISDYERLKTVSGLLLVSLPIHPADASINPHLKSRLLAAKIAELKRPKEEELPIVFESLLEKRNLKLSSRSMEFLLRRIPANTLSFEAISDRLDEVFREEGREAKFSVVRKILED